MLFLTMAMPIEEKCALCGRELGTRWNKHHLVPRSLKGKETVNVHLVCHKQIHALFSEKELARHYHTVERLLEHEDMAKFVEWITSKPIHFYPKTRRKKR